MYSTVTTYLFILSFTIFVLFSLFIPFFTGIISCLKDKKNNEKYITGKSVIHSRGEDPMSTGRNPRPGYGLKIEFHDTFITNVFVMVFKPSCEHLMKEVRMAFKNVSYKNSLLVIRKRRILCCWKPLE
jgi:hypothetical protein